LNILFYVCNALDDATRIKRGISSDSPAASRKIFLVCRALKSAGVRPVVVSLGRGRQDGSRRYFPTTVTRVQGVTVVYLPFLQVPILSELLSLFSLAALFPTLARFGSGRRSRVALFYNRVPAYFVGLFLARLLEVKTVLDLEDGDIDWRAPTAKSLKARVLKNTFDFFCTGGALLACSALDRGTSLRPTLCCYGTSTPREGAPAEIRVPIRVLLGGTVAAETGGPLLAEAIRILRASRPEWAARICVDITGKGDSFHFFEKLSKEPGYPEVTVHGRMEDATYARLLDDVRVGLALKPVTGPLAHTTFPSKVIELASQGILILTTDISDVRRVLGAGALYLSDDSPLSLIEHLHWIADHPAEARLLANEGTLRVARACAPEAVGASLRNFLFTGTAAA
jgi:hypothetical protein